MGEKKLEATMIRHGEKEAVRFTTPSGVTAVIAMGIDPALLRELRRKLERKLRRHQERTGQR